MLHRTRKQMCFVLKGALTEKKYNEIESYCESPKDEGKGKDSLAKVVSYYTHLKNKVQQDNEKRGYSAYGEHAALQRQIERISEIESQTESFAYETVENSDDTQEEKQVVKTGELLKYFLRDPQSNKESDVVQVIEAFCGTLEGGAKPTCEKYANQKMWDKLIEQRKEKLLGAQIAPIKNKKIPFQRGPLQKYRYR